eukprot:scaffold79764_cov52-Phaeocystis_antarctica.AAC.1
MALEKERKYVRCGRTALPVRGIEPRFLPCVPPLTPFYHVTPPFRVVPASCFASTAPWRARLVHTNDRAR